MIEHIALGSSLVGLNALDACLTWKGVKQKGTCKEGNPMMEFLLSLGFRKSLAFKIFASTLVAIVFVRAELFNNLIIANCIFGGICLWNFLLMRRRAKK